MTSPLPPPTTKRPSVEATPVGRTPLWRVWHPSRHALSGTQLRSFGPQARFDPHREGTAAEHGSRGPFAWYGAFLFDTATCERFARGARVVDVCPGLRATLVSTGPAAAVVDLTDERACAGVGASPGLGDTLVDGYELTQRWARHLHATRGLHGLRYWSARHRAGDGGRHGVNVVLWRKLAVDGPTRQHRLIDDALWPHVVVALDRAGVAVNRIASCPSC